MGIPVTCPQGHTFRVKDKYAGKRGHCPFCHASIVVPPATHLSDQDIADLMGAPEDAGSEVDESASVFDENQDSASVFDDTDDSSAMSLLEASAIRQMKRCPHCAEAIPFWSTRCPHCESKLS